MPRKAAGLTAAKVTKAGPGRYGDGNWLYLLVRPPRDDGTPGGRFWVFLSSDIRSWTPDDTQICTPVAVKGDGRTGLSR